jgi:hypothetical protein
LFKLILFIVLKLFIELFIYTSKKPILLCGFKFKLLILFILFKFPKEGILFNEFEKDLDAKFLRLKIGSGLGILFKEVFPKILNFG